MECSSCEIESDIVGALTAVKVQEGSREITVQVCSYCKGQMNVTGESQPGNTQP